jgi:hypothetical protein
MSWMPRPGIRFLLVLALWPATAAAADVRVYRDLEGFLEQTESGTISAPYPDFDPEDQVATLASGQVEFFRASGGLFPTEWTAALPGNDLAISGKEDFDIRLLRPHHHACGILVYEPSCAGCVDSTFLIRVIGQDAGSTPGTPTVLHEEIFQPADDTVEFIGFSSDRRMVRLEIRETVGTDDNEYFGAVSGRRDRPGSIPPGHTPTVLEINQPLDYPLAFQNIFDFDSTPVGGGYLGVTLDGIEVMATGGTPWTVAGTSPMGGRAARQPDAQETWTIALPRRSHAVEFRLWESSLPGSGSDSCFNGECFDTRYLVEAFNGDQRIWSSDYSAWNDQANRLKLWSSVAIDRLEIRGVFNNSDDELLEDLRTARSPLPPGYPTRIASDSAGVFGRFAVVAEGRALVTRDGAIELWIPGGESWAPAGALDLDANFEALDFDGAHAAAATALNGDGLRLHVIETTGDDPAAWPVTTFDYLLPARAVAIDGDLIALGSGDQVLLFRRNATGWYADGSLVPDPPVAGVTEFGRDLGLDGPLLVVGADDDVFYLYRDHAGGLTEVFRQDQRTTPGTPYVDVEDGVVVQQTFSGSLLLYTRDSGGAWGLTGLVSQSLPFANGSGLGNGVRLAGDYLLGLQSFTTPDIADFRQAVSVWRRHSDGTWVRSFVMADPHVAGQNGALLGNFGRALSIDGDWMLLGHAATPWCRGIQRGFFGDNGEQDYRGVCEGRSGAAFVARLEALDTLFGDRFELP